MRPPPGTGAIRSGGLDRSGIPHDLNRTDTRALPDVAVRAIRRSRPAGTALALRTRSLVLPVLPPTAGGPVKRPSW